MCQKFLLTCAFFGIAKVSRQGVSDGSYRSRSSVDLLLQGNKKAGSRISGLIFRHPGCLVKTLGFPPHPRGWFSIVVYRFVEISFLSGVSVPQLA
jgi:hypothetical protein